MSLAAESRNLVTEISLLSRSWLTALSSSKKLARAVSMNLVTVISLASRNLAVAVPRNSITVNSRYFVTAISSSAAYRKFIESRNLVTEISSGFCSRNFVTEMSFSWRNLVTVTSRNFVTVMSFAFSRNLVTEMSFYRNFVTVVSRYMLAAVAKISGVESFSVALFLPESSRSRLGSWRKPASRSSNSARS